MNIPTSQINTASPSSSVTYRTRDGLADYTFAIITPSSNCTTWNIELIRVPALEDETEAAIAGSLDTIIENNGRHFIEASRPLNSELDAKLFAAQWADRRQSLATAHLVKLFT